MQCLKMQRGMGLRAPTPMLQSSAPRLPLLPAQRGQRLACMQPATPGQLPSSSSAPSNSPSPLALPGKSTRAPLLPPPAAASSSSAEAAPFKWGADMKNLGICVAVALALWFAPAPAGVSPKAWHLLAVFTGTIVGIITTPLPLGAVAMLGLGAAMLTKVLTFAEAFSAFSSEIP